MKLSTVKADPVEIRSQLEADLATKAGWTDTLPTATGEIIANWIAGIGAYNQYAIERAVQEVFLDTAKNASSIYTIARMLGVRIPRTVAAGATVSLTRTSGVGIVTIPAYTQFVVNSNTYFVNSDPIVFNESVTNVVVTLVEGYQQHLQYTFTFDDFQTVVFGSGFMDSDLLVRVVIDGIEWVRAVDGIWNYKLNDKIFVDRTTANGQIEIMFGNNTNGYKPAHNAVADIYYYTVAGKTTNNAATGLPVLNAFSSLITGITTTAVVGATNIPSVELFKRVIPGQFSAISRGVTRIDLEALVLGYRDVADVKVQGEGDLHPGNMAWMNAINFTVLAASAWDSQAIVDFKAWVKPKMMEGTWPIVELAVADPLNVTATVIIANNYVATTVSQSVQLALANLFSLTYGRLGKTMYRGDIIAVIAAVEGVQHVVLTTPTVDTSAAYNHIATLGTVTLTMQYGA